MFQPGTVKSLLKLKNSYSTAQDELEEDSIENEMNGMKEGGQLNENEAHIQKEHIHLPSSGIKGSSKQLNDAQIQITKTKSPSKQIIKSLTQNDMEKHSHLLTGNESENKPEYGQEELDQLEEDILNPRNFHLNLYQDDAFIQLKEHLVSDIFQMQNDVIQREKQDFIDDMDTYLNSLNQWKVDKYMKEEQQKEQELEDQKKYEKEIDQMMKIKNEQEQQSHKEYQEQHQKATQGVGFLDDWKNKKENNHRDIYNSHMHTKINMRLQSREGQLRDIESFLNERSFTSQLQKDKDQNLYKQSSLELKSRWEEKERILKQFADFESQMNVFDDEISNILMNEKNDPNMITDEEISQAIQNIKRQKESQMSQHPVQKEEQNIQDIMKDIENEFQELDSILKEVESEQHSPRDQ